MLIKPANPEAVNAMCDSLGSVDLSGIFFVTETVDIAFALDKVLTRRGHINCIVPLTALMRRIESIVPFRDLEASSNNRIRIITSPGCQYKSDSKKFGGLGMIDCGRVQNPSAILMDMSFPWNPPKLHATQDDDYGKWVCDICGLVAKLSEKENYTKHGFTYCSIACLADHRKRGFAAPLMG